MPAVRAEASEVESSAEETTAASSLDTIARARDIEGLERLRQAVEAAGEAGYHWDIAADRLTWFGAIEQIFAGIDHQLLDTGRGYASLLDRKNASSRFEVVMRSAVSDEGEGVPFEVEYNIKPFGRHDVRELWIEDIGRWYAGSDGQPAEVFGIVRPVGDRMLRDAHSMFLGHCDPLTGMMNRGRLGEALGEAIAAATETGTTCAFLIASVSNLPVVNDAYGFDIADEVIMAVARRLRAVVRNGDLIGRYSGSKFGIILTRCTEEELQMAAERFLSVARDSVIETERGPVWAMLSIGGLVLPTHAEDANAAMAKTEEALTEAKRQPSDAFIAYRPSPERLSVRGLNARCAAEIVSSLRENRFVLAYQPIVTARDHETVFHEALLRMSCEDGDTVAAVHLIPIAEKLGLVRLIDRTVMNMAIDKLIRHPKAVLSLNVSGTTATDPRWFTQLTDLLRDNRQVTDRLIIEITETVALNDLDETVRFISSLRELGCKVAIDDFGAGYTSFRNLKVLNVDMVKIDGSFCEHLSENRDNQYFVRSLVDLARKFDLKTVAEWVQDDRDAELLSGWGVDYLQGNFFGPANLVAPWSEGEGDTPVAPPEQVFDATRFIEHGAAESDDDADDVAFEALLGEAHEHDANAFQAEMGLKAQAPGPFEAVLGGLEAHDLGEQGEADAPEPAADAADDNDERQAADTVIAATAADMDETATAAEAEALAGAPAISDAAESVETEDAAEAAEAVQAGEAEANGVDAAAEPCFSRLRAALAGLDKAFGQRPAKAAAG